MSRRILSPGSRPTGAAASPRRSSVRGGRGDHRRRLREPTRELERTEFVKVTNQHSLLARIVRAAEIDTVVDTRLIVNSVSATAADRARQQRRRDDEHRHGLRGDDSPVRKFIFKSSTHYYGSEQDDPAFFTEGCDAPSSTNPARTGDRRGRERRRGVRGEAPGRRGDSLLRCANVLGPDVDTAFTRMFALPVVPMVLGFDPRLQFVHEDDVVYALEHCVFHETPGIYNVAARRGPGPERGDLAALRSARRRCCRHGARASSPARFAASASGSRAKC